MRKRVSGYNVRMEFFITDPAVVRLSPAETRLLDLHAEPFPDGKRLRVILDLTPFQQSPSLELTLIDSSGNVAATTSIIEPAAWKLEFTLHIRKSAGTSSGVYKLAAILTFPDLGEMDRKEITVEIPSPTV